VISPPAVPFIESGAIRPLSQGPVEEGGVTEVSPFLPHCRPGIESRQQGCREVPGQDPGRGWGTPASWVCHGWYRHHRHSACVCLLPGKSTCKSDHMHWSQKPSLQVSEWVLGRWEPPLSLPLLEGRPRRGKLQRAGSSSFWQLAQWCPARTGRGHGPLSGALPAGTECSRLGVSAIPGSGLEGNLEWGHVKVVMV
jgi:hypothetical protein